jgi:hypothetical protein
MLGRWCWTKYKGHNNRTLCIISAYRPNPPGGPYTVYAQQQHFFSSRQDPRCPRKAFVEDLCIAIREFLSEGDHIILLIDGNSSMKSGDLASAFSNCSLREVLLDKYGLQGPSTFIRNTTHTPIDGIWATPGIDILAGGYFAYDKVFPGTDHRCLWIDLSFATAFGHNMPPVVRPQMRRLHCRDPHLGDNFNHRLHKLYLKYNMLQRVIDLEKDAQYPHSPAVSARYEELDTLRCRCVAEAERKCRKLKVGQVAFSPELQQARRVITVWRLLVKRRQGKRISSRLLDRSLAKTSMPPSSKTLPEEALSTALTAAYKAYYVLIRSHVDLRQTALDNLAEAVALKGDLSKATVLKVLWHREQQRQSARKLRYLRGKINTGSTTMVSIPDGENTWKDIVNKPEMEQAILDTSRDKFSQSFHTPFINRHYYRSFSFKALLRQLKRYSMVSMSLPLILHPM